MERKLIIRQIDIDVDMFITSFEEAAKLLLEQKEELERQGWSDIHLARDYTSYEDGALVVRGTRLENDAEYNSRFSYEQRRKLQAKKREEREREEYERLKLKYG